MTVQRLIKEKEIKLQPPKGKGKSVLEREFILNPYCKRIVSIARLVQTTSKEKRTAKNGRAMRAVCVCLYIDDQGQVFYTNNISPNDDYKNFENEGFLKDIPILSKLFNNIEKNKKENIEKFILEVFAKENEIFSGLKSRNRPIIEKIRKTPEICKQLKLIFSTLDKNFYEFKPTDEHYNEPEKLITHFKELREELKNKVNEIDFEKIKNYLYPVISTMSYLEDFLNVYELVTSEDLTESEKKFFEAISYKKIKRGECHGNQGVHCEMRMWEHVSKDNKKQITENTFNSVKKAIEGDCFIVSKFCCGHCGICFSSWWKSFDGDSKTSEKLGRSWSFFSGWESPRFEKDKDGVFSKTEKTCKKEIEETRNLKENTERIPLIENSETEEIINQIIIQPDI